MISREKGEELNPETHVAYLPLINIIILLIPGRSDYLVNFGVVLFVNTTLQSSINVIIPP